METLRDEDPKELLARWSPMAQHVTYYSRYKGLQSIAVE